MEAFINSISNKFKDFESTESLVNKIRYAQSKNEENNIVKTYLAKARSLLREENIKLTARVMRKIIHIQTIGYPCQFATIHCLKLIDSRDISAKHIGYLTIALIIDVNSDTPLLLCNSIRKDLECKDQYTIGLAMNCLANICSPIFVEQFNGNILKLLDHKRSYVRKKAIMCAARIVSSHPNSAICFIKPTLPLVYLTTKRMVMPTLVLAIEICKACPNEIVQFDGWVKRLCQIMKNLTSRASSTYQISGTNHPYMQIRIIKLLAMIGAVNQTNLKLIEHTFKRTFTITKQAYLAGQAIIYELILSCFKIPNISRALKDQCVTSLVTFLQSNDFNLQYVSLNMLNHIMKFSPESVAVLQSNKNSLYQCMQSDSPAVKLRAIKLVKYVCHTAEDFNQLSTLLISAMQTGEDSKVVIYEADMLTSSLAQRFYSKDQHFIILMLSMLMQNELIQQFPETVSFTKQFILSPSFTEHEMLITKLLPIFYYFLKNAISHSEIIDNKPCSHLPEEVKHDLYQCMRISYVVCWVLGEFNEIFAESDLNLIVKKLMSALKVCYASSRVFKESSVETFQIITDSFLKIISQRPNSTSNHQTYLNTLKSLSPNDPHINDRISVYEALSEHERKIIFARSPHISITGEYSQMNASFEMQFDNMINQSNRSLNISEPESTLVEDEELIVFNDDQIVEPPEKIKSSSDIGPVIDPPHDSNMEKIFQSAHIELKISSVPSKKQVRFEVRKNSMCLEALDRCSIELLSSESYTIQPWFQSSAILAQPEELIRQDFFIVLKDEPQHESTSLTFIFNFSYFIGNESHVFSDHVELML